MTTTTFNFAHTLPPWGAMVFAACGAFYAFKFVTYRGAPEATVASLRRKLGYFLAWPGLDAVTFLSNRRPAAKPTRLAWLQAGAMTVLGAAIFIAATWCAVQPKLVANHTLLVGWLGMVGMVTSFHFGLFRLAALAWRRAGVVAEPIMDRPLAAAPLIRPRTRRDQLSATTRKRNPKKSQPLRVPQPGNHSDAARCYRSFGLGSKALRRSIDSEYFPGNGTWNVPATLPFHEIDS